jgi:hypothetical protein
LASASDFDGSEARITVNALLPGGQPDAGVVAGAGPVVVAAEPVAGVVVVPDAVGGAGVGVLGVGCAGVALELVGGESPGALCGGAAAACVGALVVLSALFVTAASATATPIPAISKTMPTTAAGRRQLGGRL